MKPFPLPEGHAVSPEDRRWAKEWVKSADAERFLGKRRATLARVMAFARSLRTDMRGLLFVECGARQHDPSLEDEDAYSGAIGQFLALEGPALGIEYRAFDPEYSPQRLDELFTEAQVPDGSRVQPRFRRKPETIGRLADAVKGVSIATYRDLRAALAATDKTPLVFSNQVLNDPDLDDRPAFWRLPGLHCHAGSLMEMCMALDTMSGGHRGMAEPEEGDEDGMIRHMVAQMMGEPAAHKRAFQERFALPETTDVRWKVSTDSNIRYSWSAAG